MKDCSGGVRPRDRYRDGKGVKSPREVFVGLGVNEFEALVGSVADDDIVRRHSNSQHRRNVGADLYNSLHIADSVAEIPRAKQCGGWLEANNLICGVDPRCSRQRLP